MKVPNYISTLTELKTWCDKSKPKVIEIGSGSQLLKIDEIGGEHQWNTFRGIKIYRVK